MNLGNFYYSSGNLEKAKEFYEFAIKIQEQHYGKNHIGTAKTLMNLGNVYADLGNL